MPDRHSGRPLTEAVLTNRPLDSLQIYLGSRACRNNMSRLCGHIWRRLIRAGPAFYTLDRRAVRGYYRPVFSCPKLLVAAA